MARLYNPPHPGEVFREFLPDGMTIEKVARRLGVPRSLVKLSRRDHPTHSVGEFFRSGISASRNVTATISGAGSSIVTGALMRATRFFSALLLAYSGLSHAALGGFPERFNTEGTTVVSSVSSAVLNYVTRDTTLATGTLVREYVSGSGVVFAVTWDGPFLPDLKALLGKYFDAMVAESARMPRAGRSPIAMNRPEVVINSGGHMRAFEGSAWVPAEFPAGFTADDVR